MGMLRRHSGGPMIVLMAIAGLMGCGKTAGSLVLVEVSRTSEVPVQASLSIELDGTAVDMENDIPDEANAPYDGGYWIGRVASRVDVKAIALLDDHDGQPTIVGSAEGVWMGSPLVLLIEPLGNGSGGMGGSGGGGSDGVGGQAGGAGSGGGTGQGEGGQPGGGGGSGSGGGVAGDGGGERGLGGQDAAGPTGGDGGGGQDAGGAGGMSGAQDAGGAGGASPDGSTVEASDAHADMSDCSSITMPQQPTCTDYCSAVFTAPEDCSSLYASMADCKATCESFGWTPSSTSPAADENTLECRINTVKIGCDYGSAAGGLFCPMPPCTVYCDVLAKNCSQWVPDASNGRCLADCSYFQWNGAGGPLVSLGNVGQCFLYWAAYAGRPGEDVEVDCGKAGPQSTVCVQ